MVPSCECEVHGTAATWPVANSSGHVPCASMGTGLAGTGAIAPIIAAGIEHLPCRTGAICDGAAEVMVGALLGAQKK